MQGIVIELQRDALNRDVPVSDLLRKALVVTRKLGLPDFGEWIELELNGYPEDSNIPQYREISGQMKAWNPFHGWQTATLNDPELDELVSIRKNNQPISEIENVINNKQPGSTLQMPLHPAHQKIMGDAFEVQTDFAVIISEASLASILDTVRTTLLNWSLQLEEDGIIGEGLTFTAEEKSAATQSNYHINNFYGGATGTQIQQGTTSSDQSSVIGNISYEELPVLLDKLRDELPSLGLEAEEQEELAAEIDTVASQTKSPRPKKVIISESMQSIRRILEGASGSAAGQLLIEIGKYIF